MKAKIVVADDEPRIRKMIARLLTDEGYDVMPVENGREAVEALLSFQPDGVSCMHVFSSAQLAGSSNEAMTT